MLVSFDYQSDWHGEFELHVEVDVFDKINILRLAMPTYLEFNQSNGSAFWTYEISDIDGDFLTVSLAQPVDGLKLDQLDRFNTEPWASIGHLLNLEEEN